jgi:hypothetical protein
MLYLFAKIKKTKQTNKKDTVQSAGKEIHVHNFENKVQKNVVTEETETNLQHTDYQPSQYVIAFLNILHVLISI